MKTRRGGRWFQRWRVPLGFVVAALFILLARPRLWTLAVGGAIGLAGLWLRGWASGHLRKNDALTTTGPYAYTRNPLYLGSFLIGVGFTVAAWSPVLALIFGLLFVGIYVPVMSVESATLEELFGQEYRRYAQAVPLFVPALGPYRKPKSESTEFDPALYKRYREYQAAVGFAVAWALLVAKALYFRY